MGLAWPALLCIASGFLLVGQGWSSRAPFASDLLFRMSLSIGFGLGIFSVVLFVWRAIGVGSLVALDLVIFALLLGGFLLCRPRGVASVRQEVDGPAWLRRILTVAFATALCATLYSDILRMLVHPHGDGWDAFAIWNLHARFLFRGGLHWRDGFTTLIPWSHPDYPFLLPAAIAHFWTYLGHDDPHIPDTISLLFTFGTVGLLVSALSLLRGRAAAMLGGLTLLTTPFFIEQGAAQYADIPLSFFILATLALLCADDEDSHHGLTSHRCLVLAGLAVGFAAWTKNEGLLFLGAALAARLLLLIRRHLNPAPSQPRRECWLDLTAVLAGVAPVFLVIAWFKHSVAPPGDLFSDPATMLQKILTPARYWAVMQWYAKGFLRFGNWLWIPCPLLLIAWYLAAGNEKDGQTGPGFRSSLLALVLTLTGYFAVYVITPYDIYWHLRFSLPRLFLQLWPGSVFLFFVALPPKVLGRTRSGV